MKNTPFGVDSPISRLSRNPNNHSFDDNMKQKAKYTQIITASVIRNSCWLSLVGFAALLAGCTKMETSQASDDGNDTPVAFSAGIESAVLPTAQSAAPRTRTVNSTDGQTVWAEGDAVGVFMLAAGGTISDDVIAAADNVKYNVTPSTGALSPAGSPLYYPQAGKVDFIALYPYSDKGTGNGKITTDYKYGISVADQSHPEAIDVLYAKAPDKGKSKNPIDLEFCHVLSKIRLDIKPGDGLTGLTADKITAVTLTGMPASATLALQDSTLAPGAAADIAAVKATAPSKGATATFTALVPPQAAGVYTHRSIIVTVNGEEYTGTIPDDDAYVKNEMNIYSVTVLKWGISVGTHTIAPWDTNNRGSGTATEIGEGIEKVRIPAGTFMMGSPGTEENRADSETQHLVTLTRDFYMTKYPITNAQYAVFLNAAGVGGELKWKEGQYPNERLLWTSSGDSDWGLHFDGKKWEPAVGFDNHPAILITWYGAMEYARWAGGSLPTEAQWEYACRAGTTTAYFFGEDASLLGEYAWYSGNSGNGDRYSEKTHPVGTRKPNPWGLYDMYGNVREWCLDCWEWEKDYSREPAIDPVSTEGSIRVYRGGSHFDKDNCCRSAFRAGSTPNNISETVGFRVVFIP